MMLTTILANAVPTHVQTLRFSANVVTLVLTLLIPVAVAVVTKASLPPRWKAVLTMVLTAIVSLITMNKLDNGAAVMSMQTAYQWAVSTVIAVVSYLGFWQPVTQVNDRAAPHIGFGNGD